VNSRLQKLDDEIATLVADKQMIESKMFDCAAELKMLESGNYCPTGFEQVQRQGRI